MKRFNTFQLVIAFLNIGAAAQAAHRQQYKLCALFACYAVCSAILAFMTEK